jgi:uncharacterized coiled-coil DUF342 family protein
MTHDALDDLRKDIQDMIRETEECNTRISGMEYDHIESEEMFKSKSEAIDKIQDEMKEIAKQNFDLSTENAKY